jgi:hypothetical protein
VSYHRRTNLFTSSSKYFIKELSKSVVAKYISLCVSKEVPTVVML